MPWDVPNEPIYRAFHLTPPEAVKVVILGQDPYPKKGVANGLAFSVNPHVRPYPGSLRNIFTEYQNDLGYPWPSTGDLTTWTQRGVLLLNTALELGEFKKYERFTYTTIRQLSELSQSIVWIVWGRKAEEYTAGMKGKVLVGPHPSPLSARHGFFGSKPFSTANWWLTEFGGTEVDWKLP